MSRAMSNSIPADSKSAAHDEQDSTTKDSTTQQSDSSRRDSTKIEEKVTNVESTTVEGQQKSPTSGDSNRANPESVSLHQPEETSTESHTPDWVSCCPYCGAANEYGHVMCDGVLPGICQNGDDSGRDSGGSSERDVALYGVLSTFA